MVVDKLIFDFPCLLIEQSLGGGRKRRGVFHLVSMFRCNLRVVFSRAHLKFLSRGTRFFLSFTDRVTSSYQILKINKKKLKNK
jgi:hypothetical protein